MEQVSPLSTLFGRSCIGVHIIDASSVFRITSATGGWKSENSFTSSSLDSLPLAGKYRTTPQRPRFTIDVLITDLQAGKNRL